MAEKVVKVALIGCGRVAGHHLRSIAQTPGGEIIAVCDLVAERARSYGEQYGVKWFTDYHDMLRDVPEIDIVAIITPSGAHHEHAMDVMRRYKKHLIVEKPTFMHPAQLREAYDYAAANSLKIFPIFQNRHNKAVQRVKQALEDGELGTIRIVAVRTRWCRPQRYYDLAPWRGTFSHDGGCLSNQAIHHIDLLRYLGGEVGHLSAVLRTLGANIEVEDTAVAALKYPGGAVGNVEATTAARPQDYEASLSLVCENGLAQLGGLAVNELQIFTPNPSACAEFSEQIPDAYGFGHITVYRNIIADMNGVRPFIVSREDCLGTLNLLHAFYHSDEIGSWVDVAAGVPSSRLGRFDDVLAKLYRTNAPTSDSTS
jgi:UDP-N-acetyl-2-amino-2-deoxyglucuronate dehydrogenase